jgi:hypothetical protein
MVLRLFGKLFRKDGFPKVVPKPIHNGGVILKDLEGKFYATEIEVKHPRCKQPFIITIAGAGSKKPSIRELERGWTPDKGMDHVESELHLDLALLTIAGITRGHKFLRRVDDRREIKASEKEANRKAHEELKKYVYENSGKYRFYCMTQEETKNPELSFDWHDYDLILKPYKASGFIIIKDQDYSCVGLLVTKEYLDIRLDKMRFRYGNKED